MIIIYSHPKAHKRCFVLDSDLVTLGRSSPGQQVDLDLAPDDRVSRLHARITYENGEYWIEDLGSNSGTWVDSQRIRAKARLTPASQVKVGQTTIEVEMGERVADVMLAQSQLQLKVLYDLSQALATSTSLEQLLQILSEQLRRAIPNAQRGAVLLQDKRGELLLKAHWPPGKHSVSITLAGRASAEREAFIWNSQGEENDETPESVVAYSVQSAIYAPLSWEGQPLGVIYVDNYETGEAFTLADLELLKTITNLAAAYFKIHALEQDLQREGAIRANLLRQFSPRIAERLLRERGRLRLGGERVEQVTILISDVRGFTALSEKLEPDDVVQMLNDMFGVYIPIIFKHDGTVDKFVGDSVLAVFGSPEPDNQQMEKAVRAALDMQEATQGLGKLWQERGLPVFHVGIGIHTGEALHGFIGAPGRMEYTIIGDTVNRAARYCDGAGADQIVISKSVYEHLYRLVEVVPKTIQTKNPASEPDLPGFIVQRLR